MTGSVRDSALVIDTRRLVRRPGTMVEETVTAPAPATFGTDVLAVPEGNDLAVDLRLESVMEGVLASGTVTATATGACVRCLDDIEYPLDVTFQELFAYPDRAAHHREVGDDEDEDAQTLLEGDLLDLEPVLRDAVVPTLPFQPVCEEDCPGLCSECGQRLADDPTHQHESLDPRWAALQSLAEADTEEKRN
ncbi:MAG: YceD family protein [Mobilicoccus sp.]|nr:YceD family protein [Mobilicoccus sp.]